MLGEFFNVLDFLATFGLFVSTIFYLLRASNAAGEYLPIQIIKLALPNEMEDRAVSEMYKTRRVLTASSSAPSKWHSFTAFTCGSP